VKEDRVNIDVTVERYRFTCRWCQNSWTADYEAREITDNASGTWLLYRLNGFPCEVPRAARTVCRTCRRAPVQVTLLSRQGVTVL
jgi:pyruvate-formate lyase-activating enzyme